jgi:exoribonuclease R
MPLVTIDPEGSMDLDQALHIEREGDGFVVHYAIADLAAFITAGDPVDLEANRAARRSTAPTPRSRCTRRRSPRQPARCCPTRSARRCCGRSRSTRAGQGTDAKVERALVKSRAQLTYDGVQGDIDDGTADEVFGLLKEVGELRLALEAARGGVSLPIPEQEIDIEGDTWRLEFRAQAPVEQWNAQISLLTGMAAAEDHARRRRRDPAHAARRRPARRRAAAAYGQALKVDWPAEMTTRRSSARSTRRSRGDRTPRWL